MLAIVTLSLTSHHVSVYRSTRLSRTTIHSIVPQHICVSLYSQIVFYINLQTDHQFKKSINRFCSFFVTGSFKPPSPNFLFGATNQFAAVQLRLYKVAPWRRHSRQQLPLRRTPLCSSVGALALQPSPAVVRGLQAAGEATMPIGCNVLSFEDRG